MKRYLFLLIFLLINFDKSAAMMPKSFAPRITYYAKNIDLFNNYIRQIQASYGSAAQEAFRKAQDLLNNIEKGLKVDMQNNPVLRAYIDKKDFDIPTQRAILESLNPNPQKVSQETADRLADELLHETSHKEIINKSQCNLTKIEQLIKNGADINKKRKILERIGGYESVLKDLMRSIHYKLAMGDILPKNCIATLKLILSQPNLNVNEIDKERSFDSPFHEFLYDLMPVLVLHNVDAETIKELLKLFFERGADLEQKSLKHNKNFFDYISNPEASVPWKKVVMGTTIHTINKTITVLDEKSRNILSQAYKEYLELLKKKHRDLCGQLDKDLPFMSKDLTDLIADYAVECEFKKKEVSA